MRRVYRFPDNKIDGRPLTIGDAAQIAIIKVIHEELNGERPCGFTDWRFVQYSGHTNETGKPITYSCDYSEADAVQTSVECPRCGRWHKHVVGFTPYTGDDTAMWYQIERQEFACWNCGTEFEIAEDGSGNIYVKQSTE